MRSITLTTLVLAASLGGLAAEPLPIIPQPVRVQPAAGYFDHYQAPDKTELAKGREFEAIGGLLPIAKVYSYDPSAVMVASRPRPCP